MARSSVPHDHIDQYPYTYAAVGGANQPAGQDPAGGVGAPDVVLRVECFLCQVGHRESGKESVLVMFDKRETGEARMVVGRFLKKCADGRGLWTCEGMRRQARVIPVHAAHAPSSSAMTSDRTTRFIFL